MTGDDFAPDLGVVIPSGDPHCYGVCTVVAVGCLCGINLHILLVLQGGLLHVFGDFLDGLIVGLVAVLGAGGLAIGRGSSGHGLLSTALLGLLSLDLLDLLLGLLNVLQSCVSKHIWTCLTIRQLTFWVWFAWSVFQWSSLALIFSITAGTPSALLGGSIPMKAQSSITEGGQL